MADPSVARTSEPEPPSRRDGGSASEVWTEAEAKPRRRWHRETFACAFSGHVVPAADVASLRPEDAGVGVDLPDGRRMARCTRCDLYRSATQTVFGEGRAGASVMMIGEQPGDQEDKQGHQFVGPAGFDGSQWFRSALISSALVMVERPLMPISLAR